MVPDHGTQYEENPSSHYGGMSGDVSKSNQAMVIHKNTLLMNGNQIGPVVFPKTCLQA